VNPLFTALLTAFLNAGIKAIEDEIAVYQARKDITNIERQAATIAGQKFIMAGQQWAIRALLDPSSHDFMSDLGGKLEPIVPANPTGSAIQPGVPP